VPSPFVSDEQLLAYLLGALSPQEQLAITQVLEGDASLRLRLKSIERMSDPLNEVPHEPTRPDYLVDNVMKHIRAVEDSGQRGDFHDAEKTVAISSGIKSSDFSEISGAVNWADFLTFAICATILLSLISPAIVHYRESARTSLCSTRLVELGVQVQDFASLSQKRAFPEISTSGPFAFAGAYAIRLNDANLLTSPKILWCPSNSVQQSIVVGVANFSLPSAQEFESLPESRQQFWRHVSGGSFAYNLGFINEEEHQMPWLDSEADIAILADAPMQIGEDSYSFSTHRDDACNVLYDDGRVELIRLNGLTDQMDHPFFNRDGRIEAGLDEQDSALGSSFVSPLGETK
jgi:hypothetical protein